MHNLFSIDGKMYQALNTAWQLIELNLIFMLASLPLVSVGASLSAMYAVAFQIRAEGSVPVWSRFWKAWKANAKQASVLWALQIALAVLMVLGYWAISSMSHGATIVLMLACVLIALVILASCYWYPLSSRYSLTISQIVTYSFIYGIRHVWQSAAMVIIAIVILGYVPIFQLRLLFIWAFFGFSLTAYLHTWLLQLVFDRYDGH
ncbi:MAG: DUF624 domain-containing protein [Bifidobacterium sp.]|uniref:YesL family protein n=1 Tax=Bifidobacterium sp. TaxID=41200 RepID=UPI0039ED30FC